MIIRRACMSDLDGVNRLLCQVLEVHHKGRPDLFKGGVKKYTDEQLRAIFSNDTTPVFVSVDEQHHVCGYAFCMFVQHTDDNILTDIKTLYIDDLCVDECCRGQHIGSRLYDFVKKYAKDAGCYNLTLNVWACNDSAMAFYQAMGLSPQKIGMETVL